MSFPVQKIFPGTLGTAWKDEMQRFTAGNIVARLWKSDSSLWLAQQHEVPIIESNLGWLRLPERIEPYISQVVDMAKALNAQGLDQMVIVGMGGVNLAAAAVLCLQGENAGKRTYLLDTTDPDAINKLKSKLHFERTLFAFASKSGKRIETHALLLYFLDLLKAQGISSPGKHFVAFTEKNSYLASLAVEYKFREVFFDPPGINSRYSGLIHFGLLLSGVAQLDQITLMKAILAMKSACGPLAQFADNPAAALASFLAAGESQGLNRLIILSSDELFYFAYRIAQLVGISTSGSGRGLVPIFGQSSLALETLQRKCLVVILTIKDQPKDQPSQLPELRNLGVPVVDIELQGAGDFAAEIFKWEIATALACVPMGINCFQNEDGHGNLARVAAKLENIIAMRDSLAPGERVKERGIHLFVEGQTRRLISGLSLQDALRTFLELRNKDSYIVICPFFEAIPDYLETLRLLRDRMRDSLGMPVQISSGPRYLYALGKIYREGPANGIFIIITAEPGNDVAIPGAGYTFGEMQLAFAITEFEALQHSRLKRLSDVVIQALAQVRRNTG
jgi:transaldolase/glucose-6-phosphate isomerase